MQRLVAACVGIAGIALLSLPAAAADLRPRTVTTKMPPVVAPVAYSWTACYVGVHGGYGWGRKTWHEDGDEFARHDVDGPLAGGQLGCDWQTGQFVLGLEGQMAWAKLEGSNFDEDIEFFSQVDAVGLVVGRLGLALDRTLLYVNGGVAFAQDKYWAEEDGDVFARTDKDWRTGWTVGAGIEHALTDNWTIKIEYSYMDFGKDSVHVSCSAVACDDFSIDIGQKVHAIKFGVNFRFGMGAPVAARY